MKKYPWEYKEEIDFKKSWPDIASQYMERSHDITKKFIDFYFRVEVMKIACYAGWYMSAILGFCLLVVTK